MKRIMRLYWKHCFLCRLVLLLVISLAAFGLANRVSSAADPLCVSQQTGCLVDGVFSPVSDDDHNNQGKNWVDQPGMTISGDLLYEDYKAIEEQARSSLQRALSVRSALSPYQGQVPFEKYLLKFDTNAGWSQDYTAGWNTIYQEPNQYGANLKVVDIVDRAVTDLRRARDLYAVLAVHAPVNRFKADPAYNIDELCGNAENPNPVDPVHSGQVLDPVIDWCNFPARLRQSVREAANLRMLFGQQFMVDALGLHFSGTQLMGGESAVTREMAQLDAAMHQYELTEKEMLEGLTRMIGDGCYVSDYYQQAEWSLLSRAIENRETAQHHYAARMSYMGAGNVDSYTVARKDGLENYRKAGVDGYVNLIALSAIASRPEDSRCGANGASLDGGLLANMVLEMSETRRKATEITEGRNVLGFDTSFTPDRRYKSSIALTCDTNAGERGLWDEANCQAQQARTLELEEIAHTQNYVKSQSDLLAEVNQIQSVLDSDVMARTNCAAPPSEAGYSAWQDCVRQQHNLLKGCEELVRDQVPTGGVFDTCMANTDIKSSTTKSALLDLRSAYLGYLGIEKRAKDIDARVQLAKDKNAKVTKWIGSRGAVQTVAQVSSATLDMISCMDENVVKFAACSISGAANILTNIAAGAVSTRAEIEIEDAGNHQETENLVLDETELLIDAYSSYNAFLSKSDEFSRNLDAASASLNDALRARAYFKNSPANDPSFRMMRDSSRLQLAKAMERATRLSYLAGRRAEYEYALRLNASNFRISDIYRARNAQDILNYLSALQGITNNVPSVNSDDLTLSVARNVLMLTDEALIREGVTDVQGERSRRLRVWAREHTNSSGELQFRFEIAPQAGGALAKMVGPNYDGYWLFKLADVNGVRVNMMTAQNSLSYRNVRLEQNGLVNMRSFAGCYFDYKLIAPGAMLGQEFPFNQDPEIAVSSFKGNINAGTAYFSSDFKGRAVASTGWKMTIFTKGYSGLPDMDLEQLNDIELGFQVTHGSRQPGIPNPSDCIRLDW